jgi:hypothetical protein
LCNFVDKLVGEEELEPLLEFAELLDDLVCYHHVEGPGLFCA